LRAHRLRRAFRRSADVESSNAGPEVRPAFLILMLYFSIPKWPL
jgi:hypothetical protein